MSFYSFYNLLLAYYQCRKKKRLTVSASRFEFYTEPEIIQLENKLKAKVYRPDRFSVFVVTEPKIREIFAAGFSDRVVHHLLINYLLPIFEPKLIYDSYACRKEKGAHHAIQRLSRFIQAATMNNTHTTYYLQADIKNFFPSMKHDILYNLLIKEVKNPVIRKLIKLIIYHDCTINPEKKGQLSLFEQVPPHKSLFNVPPGQGLPIGNLTSQFFANIYLNELDQYVKHTLKCKYYIRYVDDFIIVDKSKKNLYTFKEQIELFLKEKLALELHPDKWKVKNVKEGIDALGYVLKPTHILVRKRVVKTLKKKLYQFQHVPPKQMDFPYVVSSVNSYYAHFRHADSYQLRKHLWETHFGILRTYLRPMHDYRFFQLR